MPDRKPKPERPTPHKDKICKTCGRAFPWRAEWARDWDIVKHCSDVCRDRKATASDADLEAAILTLLAEREPGKTICPSEAAKFVTGDGRSKEKASRRDWEALMEPVRAAGRRLVKRQKIVITQHGEIVDSLTAKGPVRFRLR